MQRRELFMLTLCYIRMLFWIENHYYDRLKISEPQVHWLKESCLGEIKDAIHPKVAEIKPDMILGLFVNL